MEGTEIVSNESQTDKVILTPDVEDILCFVFTSLGSADPHLDKMENYLQLHGSQQTVDVIPPSQDSWFKWQ